jgi:hypothetical protein
MVEQNEMVKTLCQSLINETWRWQAEEGIVRRDDDVQIRTGCVPIFDLKLHAPCQEEIRLSLKNRFRVYHSLWQADMIQTKGADQSMSRHG